MDGKGHHDRRFDPSATAGRNVVAYRTDAGLRFAGRWVPRGADFRAETAALLGDFPTWERCSFIDVLRDRNGGFGGIGFRALLRPEPDGTFVVTADPGDRPFDDFYASLGLDEIEALRAAF